MKSDQPSVEDLQKQLSDFKEKVLPNLQKNPKLSDLKLLYHTMDLTSLNSTDGPQYLKQWVQDNVLEPSLLQSDLKPAAVCVYPNFTEQVVEQLKETNIKTAVVATCFPTGQTFKQVKELEVKLAVQKGAQEIDMVVSRGFLKEKDFEFVKSEIRDIKKICKKKAHLKVILETCEIPSLDLVYQASYQSLELKANFIKTSTGKGTKGAEIDTFIVMCFALRDFQATKKANDRGIKAAGGIRDVQTAFTFYQIAKAIVGSATPNNFRLGVSSLAKDLISAINERKAQNLDEDKEIVEDVKESQVQKRPRKGRSKKSED